MGRDARFQQARALRERHHFDGQLAMGVRDQDERALPADKFGLSLKPGVLVMHFTAEPTPPIATVTDIQPVLDPLAPAGMLRVRLVYDVFVPAGAPNPHFLLVGTAPTEEVAPPPAEPEVSVTKPAEANRPDLVLTDAH